MKRALAALGSLLVLASGCMIRPHAGGGYDEPGVHSSRKYGVYIPPGQISSDARVAAVQVGVLLVAGAGTKLRTGVGSTPAPQVPGKTGVAPGSAPVKPSRAHPNAYLPSN